MRSNGTVKVGVLLASPATPIWMGLGCNPGDSSSEPQDPQGFELSHQRFHRPCTSEPTEGLQISELQIMKEATSFRLAGLWVSFERNVSCSCNYCTTVFLLHWPPVVMMASPFSRTSPSPHLDPAPFPPKYNSPVSSCPGSFKVLTTILSNW